MFGTNGPFALLQTLKAYLKRRPALFKFAENSLWLLFEKLIRLIVALTVGAWVARHLGPRAFGELAYAITFIAFFQGIANLGLDGIVVRDLARNPSDAPKILGTTFRLRLAAGFICWLISIALIWALRPGDRQALQLIAIIGASLVLQSTDSIDLWFQCQGQNRRTVTAKLISYAIANAIRISFILLNAPLFLFALAVLLDATLLAIALTLTYKKHPTPQNWQINKHLSQELLTQSWPFMLSGLAVLIYMRIDQIIIRQILGESQLGLYSAAISISQLWSVIPTTLAIALAPYIARKKLEDESTYMRAIFTLFRIFAAIAVTVTVIVACFSTQIIKILYGPSFSEAASALAIHVFSNIFIFMGVAQGLWLINEGLGKITLYRTALGVSISILGNILLIPHLGIRGSAVVTVIAQFFAAVGSNAFFAPRIFKMQLMAFLPIRVRHLPL